MIVKMEEDITQKEIEVIIKYARINQMVKRIETLIRSVGQTIKCSLEDREMWINASDIYYIESVDKHTFVYCREAVYRSELRLYQLVLQLKDAGFVQVSKSCVMNLNYLEHIQPLRNSRMEAALTNGERINITRKFLPSIREKLEKR